jgi:hypothetical protein
MIVDAWLPGRQMSLQDFVRFLSESLLLSKDDDTLERECEHIRV